MKGQNGFWMNGVTSLFDVFHSVMCRYLSVRSEMAVSFLLWNHFIGPGSDIDACLIIPKCLRKSVTQRCSTCHCNDRTWDLLRNSWLTKLLLGTKSCRDIWATTRLIRHSCWTYVQRTHYAQILRMALEREAPRREFGDHWEAWHVTDMSQYLNWPRDSWHIWHHCGAGGVLWSLYRAPVSLLGTESAESLRMSTVWSILKYKYIYIYTSVSHQSIRTGELLGQTWEVQNDNAACMRSSWALVKQGGKDSRWERRHGHISWCLYVLVPMKNQSCRSPSALILCSSVWLEGRDLCDVSVNNVIAQVCLLDYKDAS